MGFLATSCYCDSVYSVSRDVHYLTAFIHVLRIKRVEFYFQNYCLLLNSMRLVQCVWLYFISVYLLFWHVVTIYWSKKIFLSVYLYIYANFDSEWWMIRTKYRISYKKKCRLVYFEYEYFFPPWNWKLTYAVQNVYEVYVYMIASLE